MKRSSIVALSVIAAVAVAGGIWLVVGGEPVTTTVGGPVEVNTPLPSIVGRTLDGSTFDSADFRGRPTVINVWATWCGPCQREQPALVRLAERYGARVRFAGINVRDDNLSGAKRWVEQQYHVPYPSLYDPSGRTAHLLKYLGLPDTYVVDASGIIRWAIYGELDEQGLAGAIDRVLAAQSSGSPSP
jgi:cytochrome c biogenesis protein CcmG/thiol:disulfide interchange protein DsbE